MKIDQDILLDQYDLSRFIAAQKRVYQSALAELRGGRKRTHWMWFIFPQIAGLGHSPTARLYAISGAAEARAYITHPVLAGRLVECCQALMGVEGRTAREILGSPDDMKLRSSMTLFAALSPPDDCIFAQVLDKYYGGAADGRTMELLGQIYIE